MQQLMLWAILLLLLGCSQLVTDATTTSTTLSYDVTDSDAQMRNIQSMNCFGLNNKGQATVPNSDGWTQVSAGWLHTCAIDVSGTPQCWGDNTYGQTSVPSGMKSPLQIRAGKSHSCAIQADNSIVCWGDSSLGKLEAPTDPNYSSLCVATSHACALNTTGSIVCWGYNGQNRAAVPRTLSQTIFTSVQCKGASTCALDNNSTLHCWGHDGHGQNDIILTHATKQFFAVTTGTFGTCALRILLETETFCDPTATTPTVPTPNAICWGDTSYGQGVVPDRPNGWKTRETCEILQWAAMDQGGYHTCGITLDDDETPSQNLLQCWGLEDDGQLAMPTNSASSVVPTWVATLLLIGILLE